MKKVVVFGGGTGLSSLLRGLKLFPLDIVAVVSVADDGSSTGKLRTEFDIPAVGDLRNVVIALSETEPLLEELFQYRFKSNGNFDRHSVGNILLTALLNINGNLTDAVSSFGKILNLKGKVLPLTEDKLTLVAYTDDEKIIGEHNITKAFKTIKKIEYLKKPKVLDQVIKEIYEADLVIFSMGSLYTSIIPHLLCKEVREALKNSKCEKMYICNVMTEHGETDNFKVSDHVKLLNKYAKFNMINVVIANTNEIDSEVKKKYYDLEKAEPVLVDDINIKIIKEQLSIINEGVVRHDPLKTGYTIFSYLMR